MFLLFRQGPCPKCGHSLPENWEECPVCGLSSVIVCPNCRKKTPLDDHCIHCHFSLKIQCPNPFCIAEKRNCLQCRGSFPPE
ncbi:MAG: zinc-ribbon domain-containing protein [Oscillospiraceae bacterium]